MFKSSEYLFLQKKQINNKIVINDKNMNEPYKIDNKNLLLKSVEKPVIILNNISKDSNNLEVKKSNDNFEPNNYYENKEGNNINIKYNYEKDIINKIK